MKRAFRRYWPLALAALLLFSCAGAAFAARRSNTYPLYALQLKAAQAMAASMRAVSGYKAARNIPSDPLDRGPTGLIGEAFNGLTTTLGAIEAKRTTADPNMAALALRILDEAGVGAGDRVGANFSGSFPGLNLAVAAACEALDAQLVYVASVGASTYGANNPGLSFPEMALLLYADGLFPDPPAGITPGGSDDAGAGMDGAMLRDTVERIRALGAQVTTLPVFAENLAWRMALLGPLDCFVSVGGNVTSLGSDEAIAQQSGLLRRMDAPVPGAGSGLVARYLARGVPVVQLLNIRQLVTAYGIPYDPLAPAPLGTGAVYRTAAYPRALIAAALVVSLALLFVFRRRERRFQTFVSKGWNA